MRSIHEEIAATEELFRGLIGKVPQILDTIIIRTELYNDGKSIDIVEACGSVNNFTKRIEYDKLGMIESYMIDDVNKDDYVHNIYNLPTKHQYEKEYDATLGDYIVKSEYYIDNDSRITEYIDICKTGNIRDKVSYIERLTVEISILHSLYLQHKSLIDVFNILINTSYDDVKFHSKSIIDNCSILPFGDRVKLSEEILKPKNMTNQITGSFSTTNDGKKLYQFGDETYLIEDKDCYYKRVGDSTVFKKLMKPIGNINSILIQEFTDKKVNIEVLNGLVVSERALTIDYHTILLYENQINPYTNIICSINLMDLDTITVKIKYTDEFGVVTEKTHICKGITIINIFNALSKRIKCYLQN